METRELRTARVTTLIEPRLAEELERIARSSDTSVSSVARHALRLYADFQKETR